MRMAQWRARLGGRQSLRSTSVLPPSLTLTPRADTSSLPVATWLAEQTEAKPHSPIRHLYEPIDKAGCWPAGQQLSLSVIRTARMSINCWLARLGCLVETGRDIDDDASIAHRPCSYRSTASQASHFVPDIQVEARGRRESSWTHTVQSLSD